MNTAVLVEKTNVPLEVQEVNKNCALENFSLFIKENVFDLTFKEKMHIAKYKLSCKFWGMLYIPRVNKKSKYLFTIFRVLSAYLEYSNAKLVISKISKDKIFFNLSTHNFHAAESLKRLLYSEIINLNSIELVNENGLTIVSNPIEQTLKLKIVDSYGYSELAFDKFSIKDIWVGTYNGVRDVEHTIEDASRYDGLKAIGTISKVNYRFITGLHYVGNYENHRLVLAYRYQKFAKALDRFTQYDIKHGVDWDELLNKSIYNMVG